MGGVVDRVALAADLVLYRWVGVVVVDRVVLVGVDDRVFLGGVDDLVYSGGMGPARADGSYRPTTSPFEARMRTGGELPVGLLCATTSPFGARTRTGGEWGLLEPLEPQIPICCCCCFVG